MMTVDIYISKKKAMNSMLGNGIPMETIESRLNLGDICRDFDEEYGICKIDDLDKAIINAENNIGLGFLWKDEKEINWQKIIETLKDIRNQGNNSAIIEFDFKPKEEQIPFEGYGSILEKYEKAEDTGVYDKLQPYPEEESLQVQTAQSKLSNKEILAKGLDVAKEVFININKPEKITTDKMEKDVMGSFL